MNGQYMNDFTKEELRNILWHLVTKTVIPVGNDLVPKIQSMIDTYCEPDDRSQIMDLIGEKIKELELKIKSWDEANVSACLAPWHDSIGGISPYEKTLQQIEHLREMQNDN